MAGVVCVMFGDQGITSPSGEHLLKLTDGKALTFPVGEQFLGMVPAVRRLRTSEVC